MQFPKHKPVRLKGKAYTEFRKAVYERANGICAGCAGPVPLLDYNGKFNIYTCGHVSHIKSRGAGGSDTLDNVEWRCFSCHMRKHSGRG